MAKALRVIQYEGMKRMLVFVTAAMVLFAFDQDTDSARKKSAEAWLDKAVKPAPPESNPAWTDVLAVIKNRYSSGRLPCRVFDTTRGKYFEDFVAAGAIKQGFSLETTRQEFMKATDLPAAMTITGRKRQGCVE